MLWLREAEVGGQGLEQQPHPRVAAAQFDAVVVPGLAENCSPLKLVEELQLAGSTLPLHVTCALPSNSEDGSQLL